MDFKMSNHYALFIFLTCLITRVVILPRLVKEV